MLIDEAVRLWRWVVIQSLYDLNYYIRFGHEIEAKLASRREHLTDHDIDIVDSVHWLCGERPWGDELTPGKDLIRVCDFAKLCPYKVMRLSRYAIKTKREIPLTLKDNEESYE